MAITKFKITRALERATLKIATVDYVLDQEYPIYQQSEMVTTVDNVGVPFDSFGFKLGNNDNVWSPEYNCNINAQVLNGTPTIPVNPLNQSHLLNEIIDITSIFIFDNNTDRIVFTEKILPGYGKIVINGIDLVIGQPYFLYEFTNVLFYSNYLGTLQNVVSSYLFKVGNVNELSAEYQLNMNSSANLQVSIDTETEITGGVLLTSI